MDLDSVLSYDAVRSEVLAFEVHVDRHVVFGAASTNRRDEVDRCDSAAFLNEVHRFGCDEEIHRPS